MSTKSETKVMTKGQIAEFLKKTVATVVNHDAELAKSVDYALTHIKKATKNDLESLYYDVQACLAVENSPKKIKEEEEVDSEVVVDAKEKPKAKLKKAVKSTDKSKVIETSKMTQGSISTAKFFPEIIEHDDLGKLIAVPEKYHTYKEVFKALEEGKTLYFACYWSARQIKEYDYAGVNFVPAPKSFPHDLDLLVACIPCERVERVWCMSQYTEAMFFFEGSVFEPIKDKDPVTDEEYAIRVSKGMEFEIYVPEDEA